MIGFQLWLISTRFFAREFLQLLFCWPRNCPKLAPGGTVSHLLVKVGEKEILLSIEDIDWVEAADYYCCLHANGHRYMIRGVHR